MLTEVCTPETLRKHLCSRDEFRPFPKATDRGAWEALPAETKSALLAEGEAALGKPWAVLPATEYLGFAREGNRSRYEKIFFGRRSRLAALVLAECVEGKGRFVDEALNGLWAVCEESSWCLPAHIREQRAGSGLPDVEEPIVDLFAGETGALAAWTLYLIGDALDAASPLVRPRAEREVRQRILDPCMGREFRWMKFGQPKASNWNAWVNSNWLACILTLEPDHERRVASVARSLTSLDVFVEGYAPDGGCDEGPSYWGHAAASLVDALDWLSAATGGKLTFYDRPAIKEMVRFFARVHIHDRYFASFADGPGVLGMEPALVWRCGKRIGDEDVASLGAYLASLDGPRSLTARGSSLGRGLWSLFGKKGLAETPPRAPYFRDVWLPDIQIAVARDKGGTPEGFCVVAKGGHNAELHNHNDVGNFILHVDGLPVAVDAGVGTYSAKTFGAERYSLWTMQSSWHNLPEVNGHMQRPGEEFAASGAAHRADDERAEFRLDIAGAYPSEAGLRSWKRRLVLNRGLSLEVHEQAEFASAPENVSLHFLTPCEVNMAQEGRVEFLPAALADGRKSGKAVLEYDADQFAVHAEEQILDDEKLAKAWGPRLTRIVLRRRSPQAHEEWALRFVK